MNTRQIDGILFEKMVRNGYANLRVHEQEINDLNVFPVADGDTGNNMRLTLENGIKNAEHHRHLGNYLKELASGMLLGARGNSGVILSQMFKGMANTLARSQAADIAAMRNAFINAYRTAYSTVAKPVEGTILTVSREGIEHIRTQLSGRMSQEELFSMYIAEMRKTLALTPEMLPCLKEAGVVDSGAVGYITITEGMLKALFGERINWKEILGVTGEEQAAPKGPNFDFFTEESPFIDGYCMEFILQRLKSNEYNQIFRIEDFTKELEALGESVVAVEDGTRVKVHVHTKRPARVINLAQDFGEFLTFKLENMQLQHNEHDGIMAAKKGPRRKLAFLAVCDNDATRAIFSDFQSDCILGIDDTTNVSVQELMSAFERMNADQIIVLPNNKNGIFAAEQAGKMFEKAKVYVLPTKSVPEGYMAFAGMTKRDGEVEELLAMMKSSMDGTDTMATVTATRAYEAETFSLVPGDFTGILNDDVASKGETHIEAFLEGLKQIEDIEDKYLAAVFAGVDTTDEEREALEEAINEEYPDIEVSFLEGGSKIYHWLAAIS